jgi:anti-anti-sigma regulatory factor
MHKDDTRVTEGDSQYWAVRDADLTAVGALVVRTERCGAALIFWLSGALDRAASRVLDDELDAQADHATRVMVDLTGLASIDSYGLTTLERILRRTRERDQSLCFRRGPHVGQRPRELTHDAQLRFRAAASRRKARNDDDYLFALAMACADVVHQRPRDRPRAAQRGYPGQAAGASDAAPSPGVARAAPRMRVRASRRSASPAGASPHDG